MFTPSSSPNNFDFIAPLYDRLAATVFGDAQRRAEQQFLSQIPTGADVLILGGGSGQILNCLFQKSQPRKVLFLEASAKMAQKARARWQNHPHQNQVEFRVGTEKELRFEERFHVVITPFVLDLFTGAEVAAMLQKLSTALLPDGVWLHTDFHLSAGGMKKLWQQPLLWAMYRFFRNVSGISGKKLPEFDLLIQRAGFETIEQAFFYGSFIRAQVLKRQ